MKCQLSQEYQFQSIFSQLENIKKLALVFLASILIALASQLAIDLVPVPITLQTFAILLIGMSYGPRLGSASVVCYLLEGALGLPVFAEGSGGLAVLLGPSGGYLWAFLPATFLSGYLLERGWAKNGLGILSAGLVAMILVYSLGASQLSLFVGWHKAISLGVIPFLLADGLKLLALCMLVPLAWKKR